MLRQIRFDTAQGNPGGTVSSQFVQTQKKHLTSMKSGFSDFLKVSMNLRRDILNSGDILLQVMALTRTFWPVWGQKIIEANRAFVPFLVFFFPHSSSPSHCASPFPSFSSPPHPISHTPPFLPHVSSLSLGKIKFPALGAWALRVTQSSHSVTRTFFYNLRGL